MKKVIALLCFVALNNIIVAQTKQIIGRDFKIGNKIAARKLLFDRNVEWFYIDSVNNKITYLLGEKISESSDDKGVFLLYDVHSDSIIWQHLFTKRKHSISQKDTLIYMYEGRKAYLIDYRSGRTIKEVHYDIYYTLPEYNIALGYQRGSTDLCGFRLDNESVLWTKYIPRESGWNDVIPLSDTTLLISSGGLHFLNINNGQGTDYRAVTTISNYSSERLPTRVAVIGACVAIGMLTGIVYIPASQSFPLRELESNIIIDSNYIYWASRETFYCFERSGKIKWSYPLATGLGSKSSIFIRDSLIYMVNYGAGAWGNSITSFGSPYFVAFNKITGKRYLFTSIMGKSDPICAYKLLKNENTFLLVFKNRISKYSLTDGSLIQEKPLAIKTFKGTRYFIGDNVYIKKDTNSFVQLQFDDTAHQYIASYSDGNNSTESYNEVMVVNQNLNVVEHISMSNIYSSLYEYKGYTFFIHDNQGIFIDEKNQKRAVIDVSDKASVSNHSLYDIGNNSFSEVDLNEIIDSFINARQ